MRVQTTALFIPLTALLLGSCGGGEKPGEAKDSVTANVSVTTTDHPKDTLTLAADTIAATTTVTPPPATTGTNAAETPSSASTTTTPGSPNASTTPSKATSPATTPPATTPSKTTSPTATPTPPTGATTPPVATTPKPAEPPPARTPDPTPPVATTPPSPAGVTGASLFASMKCTTCHNVSSQGITGGKVKDLAGVGSRHSKSWIVAFLQKKEMLDGKPHKKTWAGTDEELDVIATWLATLK